MTRTLKLLVFLTVCMAGLAWVQNVYAADQTITCDSSGCSTPSGPIFNETNLTPGVQISKSLQIVNNRSETLFLNLTSAKQAGSDDPLSDQIGLLVLDGGTTKFNETLGHFMGGMTIDLGPLMAGNSKTFTLRATLPDLDNSYQAKQAKFNLYLNVAGQTTDNGTQNNSSPTTTTQTSSGGGSVLGAVSRIFRRSTLTALVTVEPTATPSGTVVEVPAPQVLGDQTNICQAQAYPWWWPLILEAGLVILWLKISSKRQKGIVGLGLFVIALLVQSIHIQLGCNCATSVWCRYFWVFNLSELIAGGVMVWRRR